MAGRVVLRLDRADLDALATWLRGLDVADPDTHRQLVDELAAHRHRDTEAGRLARRVLQLLAWQHRRHPGYQPHWAP